MDSTDQSHLMMNMVTPRPPSSRCPSARVLSALQRSRANMRKSSAKYEEVAISFNEYPQVASRPSSSLNRYTALPPINSQIVNHVMECHPLNHQNETCIEIPSNSGIEGITYMTSQTESEDTAAVADSCCSSSSDIANINANITETIKFDPYHHNHDSNVDSENPSIHSPCASLCIESGPNHVIHSNPINRIVKLQDLKKTTTSNESISLVLKIPNGLRLQASLCKTETLKSLQRVAEIEFGMNLDNCYFVSDFPRIVFDNKCLSLAECGIGDRTVLYMEEIDK